MKKLVAAAIIAAGLFITVNSADAHVNEVTASCESGVSVVLDKYAGGTVAVSVDDRTVLQGFTSGGTFSLTNPDKTVTHTWSVVVTSDDGIGAFIESGEIPACVTPPPTTTTPPPPVVPPAPPAAVKAPPRTAG